MNGPEPGAEPESEPVEETDEKAEIYVADPDDYAKTRKLKALNDAKSHVRKIRNNLPTQAPSDEWDGLNARMGEAVASYGHELLPLLEDAERAGKIAEADYETTAVKQHVDVREFVRFDGRIPDYDGTEINVPHPSEIMAIYRHLQSLERKLGLGLTLEEQTDDEWEIET